MGRERLKPQAVFLKPPTGCCLMTGRPLASERWSLFFPILPQFGIFDTLMFFQQLGPAFFLKGRFLPPPNSLVSPFHITKEVWSRGRPGTVAFDWKNKNKKHRTFFPRNIPIIPGIFHHTLYKTLVLRVKWDFLIKYYVQSSWVTPEAFSVKYPSLSFARAFTSTSRGVSCSLALFLDLPWSRYSFSYR